MNKMNEINKKSKINSLLLSLEKNNNTDNANLVLIALFDLAVLLSDAQINEWLGLDDQYDRADFLTNAYRNSGIKRIDLAKHEADLINRVDINLIRNLMPVIAAECLPNMEIAVELQDNMESMGKRSGQSSTLTKEMAELSYEIICGPEFSKEHFLETDQVAQILCAGTSAVFFTLRAGQSYPVDYDLYNATSGQFTANAASGQFAGGGFSHVKKILNIAGGDVQLFQPGLAKLVVKNRSFYKVGLLAAPWKGMPLMDGINSPWSDAAYEVNSLPLMMEQIRGRLVCVVPTTWLSKTFARNSSLKDRIVRNKFLEAVIQFPAGILYSTNIAPALLVINNHKSQPNILFIDASGDAFTTQVSRHEKKLDGIDEIVSLLQSRSKTGISELKSTEDVIEMRCNLDVKRYVRSPESEKIDAALAKYQILKLYEIAEIIGCQAIKTESGMFSENATVSEISAANIDQYGMIDDAKGYKSITPVYDDIDRVKRQQLKAGDVIFAIKGSVGKCALIDPKHEGYLANQSFAILRLHKKSLINGVCLFRFLQSELGQAIVNRLVTGNIASMIKMNDLKELPVPILEKSSQEEHIVLHKKVITLIDARNEIEEKIKETVSHFWPLDL